MPVKRILFILACSLQFGVSAQNETVALNSFYDSLSYAMGVENAAALSSEDAESKFDLLDKMALVRGFQSNLFGEPIDTGCERTLQKFLGRHGDEFDTEYLKEGSQCIGSFIGFEFYTQMKEIEYLEDLNMSLVLIGFKQGVFKQYEKFLSSQEKNAIIRNFGKKLEQEFLAEIEKQDQLFWAKLLQTEGVQQVGETGIYFETIEQGNGGKPTTESDIEAHYILTNTKGDTLESSYANGTSLKINLGSVIAGWREGFPALEKGGKYRLYIPYEKAYKYGRPEAPQGALCFFIEFIDFGDRGSIAPPFNNN